MEGKRSRGRPTARCIDQTRNYIEMRGENYDRREDTKNMLHKNGVNTIMRKIQN